MPAILFLLLTGILLGPITGLLDSDALLGDLLFPFVSLSVAVILFEGSLTLRYHEIARLRQVVRRLVTIGVLVTWLIGSVATHFILHFSWGLSLLLGAVTVVTGPTVIVPMLRTVRPSSAVANILRWEGIVIDPIGATLAVLVFEFIVSSSSGQALSNTLFIFTRIVAIGLLAGAAAGYLYGIVLRRHWLPEYLHNVGTLSLVFLLFAVSNYLQHESGLLSVTVMGIWLANMRHVPVDEILDFKESLSVLLISVLFIILAARLDLSLFFDLGWQAVFILLAVQFLARPLSVMIAAFGSKLTWSERHLLAWIAPRGIVAAAIAALFAIRLEQFGYAQASMLVPMTFLIIIGTVVLQGTTARFIAQRLGVAEPFPKGVLIIGANQVAIAIAKVLQGEGLQPLLVDTSWNKISKARMEGLDTYYGNAVSEHADRHLDLIGIGKLLALSAHGSLNTLSCMHYRMELGYQSVFSVRTASETELTGNRSATEHRSGLKLFSEDVTFSTLAALLSKGGGIHATRLSESFSYDAYMDKYGGKAVLMFVITPDGELEAVTNEKMPGAGPNSTVIALLPDVQAT